MVFPDITAGVYAPEELTESYEELPESYKRTEHIERVDPKAVERESEAWLAGRT